MGTFFCDLLTAYASQTTLMGYREHASLDPEKLAAIGRAVGEQVRIVHPTLGTKALFTVTETRQESPEKRIRTCLDGRKRLDPNGGTFSNGTCNSSCLRSDLTDAEAEAQSEFVERVSEVGTSAGLVVLAPHGGAIESGTDDQAEAVFASLSALSKPCVAWRCKGWRAGGGAYSAWHITSTEIHENSFPALAGILNEWTAFPYGVSFHGYGEDIVAVGGGAPRALLDEVAEAISAELGTDHPVEVVTSGEYAGTSPENIVNWLTTSGGVQIEQPLAVRTDHWQAVAAAVAAVFAAKL